jgi:Ca-activated chloride channel family protein
MSGQQLTWAATDQLWMLGLLALAALGVGLHFRWKSGVMRRLGDLPLIQQMISGVSFNAQRVRWILMLLALGMIIAALLRPQYGTREAQLQNRGVDVVIALDLSKSMMVRDVAPNRLKAAIAEVNQVLDGIGGGRVALVPFAGTAYTQTPLTTDLDAVRSYLDELRVEDMPIGGTRLGVAIRHALGVFEDAAGDSDEADKEDEEDPDLADLEQPQASYYRALILVTDGEDHDDDALEAARAAAGDNVRIYTVGIGSRSSSSRIPVVSSEGDRVGWVNNQDAQPVFSDLNIPLLKDIAGAADGAAFIYGQDDVAGGLANALDGLEKQEYEHHYDNLNEDRFQFVLFPALLLLLLEALLSDRRRKKRRGRPTEADA